MKLLHRNIFLNLFSYVKISESYAYLEFFLKKKQKFNE